MCSIVVDTVSAERNSEVLEIAIVPLDFQLEIHDTFPIFNITMKPDDLASVDRSYCRQDKSLLAKILMQGPSKDLGLDLLEDWFEKMKLRKKKRIIPLVYNWPLVREKLIQWMGYQHFLDIFAEDFRDILSAAHILNDRAGVRRQDVMFSKQTMRWIMTAVKIPVAEQGGSALGDCRDLGTCYKRLIQMGI